MTAARLIRNARSFPFHLHIVRSMLHLTRHTHTYVPLAPYLLPILTSTLSASSKPKASTLRPLDFETAIRAPQQYLKTRVYNEGLAEESAFLLAEYLASPPVHGSIGFPEVTVPIVLLLRKAVKGAKGAQGKGGKGKEAGVAKALVERVEESARWAEQKRKGVTFTPGKMAEVERWEEEVGAKVEDTPLGRYVKVQRKAREKRKKLVEKVRLRVSSCSTLFAGADARVCCRHGTARTRSWRIELAYKVDCSAILYCAGYQPCILFCAAHSPSFRAHLRAAILHRRRRSLASQKQVVALSSFRIVQVYLVPYRTS